MGKRLQIVLMGWEMDRLIYGIKQKSPQKVIFISSDSKKTPDRRWGDKTTAIAEQIGESISKVIDSEILFFEYHNLDSCLEKTVGLLEKYSPEYDEITVNISSGSTLIKTAMILAAQYYPIQLFYVIPKDYTHPCEIITHGVRGMVDLPSINLKNLITPVKKEKQLLLLLSKETFSFTKLTKDYAKQNGIKATPDKIKTLKSGLFYHLKKLKEKGLINMNTTKDLELSLTQTGSFMKLILEHEQKKTEYQTTLKSIVKKGK